MEFCRPEYWSGLPFTSPGDFPNPGIDPRTLQVDSLSAEPPGKPKLVIRLCLIARGIGKLYYMYMNYMYDVALEVHK